jgi:hypothetical protein
MSMYYPEMGETKQSRLFDSFHVINSTYSIRWSEAREAEAQAAFKALRIRPRGVETSDPSSYIRPIYGEGVNIRTALVTHSALTKLLRSDRTAHEMLLD